MHAIGSANGKSLKWKIAERGFHIFNNKKTNAGPLQRRPQLSRKITSPRDGTQYGGIFRNSLWASESLFWKEVCVEGLKYNARNATHCQVCREVYVSGA